MAQAFCLSQKGEQVAFVRSLTHRGLHCRPITATTVFSLVFSESMSPHLCCVPGNVNLGRQHEERAGRLTGTD